MLSVADRAHQLAQAQLGASLTARLAALTAALPAERSAELRDAYALATARTVAGAQWAAGTLALAYIAAYAAPVREPNLSRVLEGRLMTPESPGAFVGLLRTWAREDEGASAALAREEGGSYAAWLARGDLQAAQREGLDEGADAAEREPRWAKIAGEGACDWCKTIAGDGTNYVYYAAENVPFHQGCGCSVEPQFRPVARLRYIASNASRSGTA